MCPLSPPALCEVVERCGVSQVAGRQGQDGASVDGSGPGVSEAHHRQPLRRWRNGYDVWMRTRTDAASHHSTASRFFRSPETGRVVVVQMPNIPLWVFLAATAVRLVFHPTGVLGTVVSLVGTVGLVVWAGLEIVRGDSPFRRVLGAGVLVAVIARLIIG